MTDLDTKLEILAGLKQAYAEAKADFEKQTAESKMLIDDLESEISAAILDMGESVKTEHISAIWNKGKTTWDGRLLEGYAIAHPDILAARKVGEPTVSFRLTKK